MVSKGGGGAIELLGTYLRDRQQRIKIGPHTSAWEDLIKGVPRGSILGPLMFNVFINDIFYFIQDSTLYNYADDCTVLKSVLERDSEKLIEWFSFNNMKANPDKFQAICLGKKANDSIKSFNIASTKMNCEDNAPLLGVNIDYLLKFDDHVSDICIQEAQRATYRAPENNVPPF